MSGLYVSGEEWARWNADMANRTARARTQWAKRRQRDLAKAAAPTRVDLECQLHALRHHNTALLGELGSLREALREERCLLSAVLDEFEAYRERNPERVVLRAA